MSLAVARRMRMGKLTGERSKPSSLGDLHRFSLAQ